MKRVEQLVAGKTVALVGNAISLTQGENRALEIDSHDVVIRMNAGLPTVVGSRYIGKRTTIWATAKHFGMLNPDCAMMVFMKLTKLGDQHWGMFLLDRHRPYPMVRWSQALEDEVKEFVGADPGTGIRLLYWLKRIAHPKWVSIFGMDCWSTPSNWSKKYNTPNHKPDLERTAIARLMGA